MKLKSVILTITVIILAMLCFCACSADKSAADSPTATTSSSESYSYKEQMDIAMKNASNNTVLAKVNDIEITQVDIDIYSIDGKERTLEDIIKYFVITDYGEKNSLKIDNWTQNLYDSVYSEMQEDSELTEEYCRSTYGISKSEVIEYSQKRIYQVGMNSAFSDMIIDQVSSGECPKLYPELKRAYKKFEKDKLKKGSKAWDDIEQAYYDMIVKDYDIVIY